MLRDFEIVKEKIATTFVGDDGNLQFHTDEERFVIKNNNNETVSHQYYCMLYLGNDHFAVCDMRNSIRFFSDYDYYDIINGNYNIGDPKLKWGIIRLTRDEDGKIIPGAEVRVIPSIYDRISENNLHTATAKNGDGLTYIDLDPNRSSYMSQLVPCVLNHAVPFSVSYQGFAECSVNGVIGYLPRDCKVKESIESDELLTRAQALAISNYLNSPEDYFLDNDTILKYFNLTGRKLIDEKGQQLKKTIN